MKNMHWLLFALIAPMILLVSGCPGKPSSITKEKITLQMWIMPNSLEPVNDIYKTLEGFNKKHPNIKVVVTSVDWGSAWTKLTTAATSGDAPDIVQIGSTWVGSIAATDSLLQLNDRVASVGGKDSFVPAAWTSTGLDGTVSAIPWIVDARAIYYRKDLLQKAGVNEADLDTWESFEKALAKLKNADLKVGKNKIYPFGITGKNDWNVIHNLAPWIWGAGGDFLTPDSKKSALDSEQVYNGVMFYLDLVKKGYVPLDALELNTAQVSTSFNNGAYAMYIDGPYETRTLTTPPGQGGASESIAARHFGVAPAPKGPKGRFTFVGGSNLAIFKNSKHPNEAFEVIKYLTSFDAQVSYCKASGFLPAKLEAFNDPYFSADPRRKVFKDAVKYGRSYPCIPAWGIMEPQLNRSLGIMWDYVTGKNYSPENIKKQLKLAAQEMNSILSQ
ncbi:MAG: sugar ABC transporter substrate-binding protein [bacterium]